MMNPLRNGTLIALTAASLFAAACNKTSESSSSSSSAKPAPASSTSAPVAGSDTAANAPDDKTAKVHCQGVNECKGKASCKSTANACAGQNGCKGKGHVDGLTADECKLKGGTILASN